MDAATESGLLDAVRTMIGQMDIIIDLLKRLAGSEGDMVGLQEATMELVAMMIGATMNAAPRTTLPIVVGTTETVLAQNESEPLMLIGVTNHDPAQAIQVGSQGVTILAGSEVPPLTTVPFVLPLGRTLFGICTAATVNVSVAMRYPPIDLVNAIKDALQWKQLVSGS